MNIQVQCKHCGNYKRVDKIENIAKGMRYAVICGSCKGIIIIIVEKEKMK